MIGNLVLVVLGGVLAGVAFAAVPADVVAMRALGWCTVAAVVATLALAAALAGAASRRVPAGAPACVGGTAYLLLQVAGPIRRERCPRPWRRARPRGH